MTNDIINNPHDKFFKENFSRIDVAQNFLANHLPEEALKYIDINHLEPKKDGFVNRRLAESHSDILYSTRIGGQEGYLYFLFEHKSYVERDTMFQLMHYMTEIWRACLKQGKKERTARHHTYGNLLRHRLVDC